MTNKWCYDECFTGVPEEADMNEKAPMREGAKGALRRLADEYRSKANQVDALAASLPDNVPHNADDMLWKWVQDAIDKLHNSL